MLNDPQIRYEYIKMQQRERWREAELARQARAATASHQHLSTQKTETTSLIARIMRTVWKRLGLPAREPVSQSLPAPLGEPMPLAE